MDYALYIAVEFK